jgi:hypothetical protein
LALSGPAVVDSCVATGQPGYYTTFPYTVYPSAPAIAVDNGAPLWVVHSTLAGGSSATVGTAAPLAVGTGSATVVGASTLTGSGTPPPSMRFSADTTWNGLPPPAALTIPSLSWLASAVTAPVGGTLSITSTLQPLDIVFLFFDTRMLFLPAPGFALPLQLDPTSAFLAGVLTQGTPSYSLLVPSQPSLTGLATHWQGIAVGAQFALTNARTILLR